MTAATRDYAVALEGTAMTFECGRAGHRYVVDYGKERRPARRVGAAGLRFYLGYWSRRRGGTSPDRRVVRGGRSTHEPICPACRRARRPDAAGKGD